VGRGAPLRVPFVEPGQLGRKDDCLHGVKTRVETDLVVAVLDLASVVAELSQPTGGVVRIGEDGASVTVGPEVLPRVEARPGDVPDRPGRSTVLFGALRLGRILDNGE